MNFFTLKTAMAVSFMLASALAAEAVGPTATPSAETRPDPANTPPPGEVIREAESATLLGSRIYDDPAASGGKAVGWMGAVRFDQAPAANCIRLRYAWNEPTVASITVNDRPPRSVVLVGGKKITGDYCERLFWIDVPAHATVTVAGKFNFDRLTFATVQPPAVTPRSELPIPPPASVPRWELASDDTLATVAVWEDRPCLVRLKNRKQQWEWIRKVRPMPLLDTVVIDDRDVPVTWVYREATHDKEAGTLTLRFTCEQPALELRSRWRARPGPGPVEHLPTLINRGKQKIFVSTDLLLAADLDLAADQALKPVRLPKTSRVGWLGFRSEGLPLPYEILQAGAAHGLHLAYDFDFGEGQTLTDPKDPARAGFRFAAGCGALIPLDPDQELTGPGMHHLAYAGDEDDGANRFRRWFWNYEIPASLRDDLLGDHHHRPGHVPGRVQGGHGTGRQADGPGARADGKPDPRGKTGTARHPQEDGRAGLVRSQRHEVDEGDEEDARS